MAGRGISAIVDKRAVSDPLSLFRQQHDAVLRSSPTNIGERGYDLAVSATATQQGLRAQVCLPPIAVIGRKSTIALAMQAKSSGVRSWGIATMIDRDAIKRDLRSNFLVYMFLWFLPIAIKLSSVFGVQSKLADNMPGLGIWIALCSLALGFSLLIKYKGQGWL